MRGHALKTRLLTGLTVILLVAGCAAGASPTPMPTSAPSVAAATPPPTPTVTATTAPTPILTQAPSPTPSVEMPKLVVASDAIQAARSVQSLLERHNAAWDTTKSADDVLALWADEVRFTDLLAGWRDEPRATLERMVRTYVGTPGLGSSPHGYFVDTTGGVDSYDVWGLGDATEANPVHEIDVLETEDGLLTSMRTVYDVKSLAHITGRGVADLAPMQALAQGYADAWSSGEPSSVAELYAQTASRADKLWGESAEGRQAISDAAARYFSLNPGAVWQMDMAFGDGPGQVMNGGIFTVRLAGADACELDATVVLETNDAQKIVSDRVFWELDSLVRCGLA